MEIIQVGKDNSSFISRLHFKLLFVSLKHLIGETRSLAELDVQELEVPPPMEVVFGAGARTGLSLNSS